MKIYKIREKQISVFPDTLKSEESELKLKITWKDDHFPIELAKGKSSYTYGQHITTADQKEKDVEDFENKLRQECYAAESGPYVRTIVITPPHNDTGYYEIHIKTFYRTRELSDLDGSLHRHLHDFGKHLTFKAKRIEDAMAIKDVWFSNFEQEIERRNILRNDAGTTSNDQGDSTTYEALRNGSKQIETMYDSFRRQIRFVTIDDLIKNGVVLTFINTGRIGVDAVKDADGNVTIYFHKLCGITNDLGYEKNITIGEMHFSKEEFAELERDSEKSKSNTFYTNHLQTAIFWGIINHLNAFIRERDNDECPLIDEIPLISFYYEKNQYEVVLSTYPFSQCTDNYVKGRKFKVRIKKDEEVIQELDAFLADDQHQFICNRDYKESGAESCNNQPAYDFVYNFSGSLEELEMILYEIFKNVMEDYQECTTTKTKKGYNNRGAHIRVYTPPKKDHIEQDDENELPF